jgi:hypothetical protein
MEGESMTMRVFANNTFDGFYPVGTAAVVVADSPETAATMLKEALGLLGLNQEINPADMREVETGSPSVVMLRDGNY